MLPAGARSLAAEGQERRLDRVVRGSVASRRQLNGYVEDIRRIPCLDVVQGQRAGAVPIACDFELHYRESPVPAHSRGVDHRDHHLAGGAGIVLHPAAA